MENLVTTGEHVATGTGGIEPAGIGERGGDEGTLRARQVPGLTVEVPLGHGIGSIDAITHLNGVEIDLHDALLAPEEFNKYGEIGLEAFANPRTARPQKDVLGSLLGDGAGTKLAFLRMLPIATGSIFNCFEVEAMMFKETLVLTGHDCHWQRGGDVFERNPMMTQRDRLTSAELLSATDKHQGREIDGYEAVGNNRKDSGGEECHHYPFEPFQYPF